MRNPNNIKAERSPNLRGRGGMILLGGIMAVLLILLLVGWIYEPIAEAAEAKANPPTGQMVDVGGYRLHIHCTGSGSPTVVIESGWGESSATWGWVQPEVAKITRVCTYDRAGMGWSEPSPYPRTARQFAKELHTLLAKVNEPGPYVLVAHSLGGYTVRVYAYDYPDEVSGLVRLLAGPLGAIQNLPPAEKQAYYASAVTPLYAQTFVDEGRGMSEGGAQARDVTTLGALPVIVLSRGKDQDAKHTTEQTALLQLSTDSQQFFAENSGHNIMIDQPEAAIAAIIKMVEQVRK
jgi:pimeloyl-ACP methyl ester carboxylesterase